LENREKIIPDAESRQLVLDLLASFVGIFAFLMVPLIGANFWNLNGVLLRFLVLALSLATALLVRCALIPSNRYLAIAYSTAFVGSATSLVIGALSPFRTWLPGPVVLGTILLCVLGLIVVLAPRK
jgi:hypothetical protein